MPDVQVLSQAYLGMQTPRRPKMQHNNMLLSNIRIEQAELQAQARAERRAQEAQREAGRTPRGFLGRLLRR
jgi:hypothetical protein